MTKAALEYLTFDAAHLGADRLGGGWTLDNDDDITPELVERFSAAGVTVTTA